MRSSTRLTGRGIALVIFGGAAAVASAAIGEADLLILPLTLVVLPLIAWLFQLVTKPKLMFVRRLEPAAVTVGQSVRTVLTVENHSSFGGLAIRFTDQAPAELGGGASFTMARGFGRWRQAVGYGFETSQRGRFEVGPLLAQYTDPFGLARKSFAPVGTKTMLRVAPRIWPLSALSNGSGFGSAGDATAQRIGQAGNDDVLVREHRHGDDIRRVHWKMSAKRDDLMVRLEENPWDPAAALIIDTRLSAHSDTGPTGSFEWSVSAVTSIAALLASGNHRLRILAPGQVVFDAGRLSGEAATGQLIEAMTDLSATAESELATSVADPERLNSAATLIAVTGALEASDAAALIAASGRARRLIALVPDLLSWGLEGPTQPAALALLRSRGWRVETYRPRESVSELWERVAS